MEQSASWRALYGVASWAALLVASLMVGATAGFAVWPIVPDTVSAADLVAMIVGTPLKALVVLDPVVLLVPVCLIPVYLALFVSLRHGHPSLATIALALGLVSVPLFITTRPLVELFSIAHAYAGTVDSQAQQALLSAATAMLNGYHGTAWTIASMLAAASFLISAILMLGGSDYRRTTAWAGVASNAGALLVAIPLVGRLLLFAFGTVVGIAWFLLLAGDLRRSARVDT